MDRDGKSVKVIKLFFLNLLTARNLSGCQVNAQNLLI